MIKAKDGLIARKFGEKYVVVAVGDMADEMHKLITLNEVGMFIFERLKNGIEYGALLKSIIDTYDVEEHTAKGDLDMFLQSARQAGIINE